MKFEILNPFILMLFVIFKLNTCAFGWIKTSSFSIKSTGFIKAPGQKQRISFVHGGRVLKMIHIETMDSV